ncbi:MAG TPA: 4Fe-4S dicluster domain-containing protein [Bacteroidota bacterium]
MAIRGNVSFDIETCKGCELCIDACPQESLALSQEINAQGYHYAVLIKDNCTGCVNCALVCPDAVITVFRENRKNGKVPVARISNVTGNITVTIDDERKNP